MPGQVAKMIMIAALTAACAASPDVPPEAWTSTPVLRLKPQRPQGPKTTPDTSAPDRRTIRERLKDIEGHLRYLRERMDEAP